MRICLASLHPRILSGQIDSMVGLGRALTRRGHCVRLVAPFDATGLLEGSLASLDSGPHRLMSAVSNMLRTVPKIIDQAREAELVHLALPTPAFGLVAEYVRAQTATPILVSYEGHLVPGRQVLHPERLRRSWKTYVPLWGVNNGIVARLGSHSAPLYVVSSDYQSRELRSIGVPADRIAIVPNIIEYSKLSTCEPEIARRQFGMALDGEVIGYIGHFNDVKGVDVLAKAFLQVARERPRARLALAWSGQGNGDYIRHLLSPVLERVIWLGKVHVGRFLSAIDALALPYRLTAGQGAYPSLVLEAMHAGRPVVTSALPLLQELVGQDPVALLCPPEDHAALAQNVLQLLANPALRQEMAAAQMRVMATRFAPEALAAQYESLYDALVSMKGIAAASAAA